MVEEIHAVLTKAELTKEDRGEIVTDAEEALLKTFDAYGLEYKLSRDEAEVLKAWRCEPGAQYTTLTEDELSILSFIRSAKRYPATVTRGELLSKAGDGVEFKSQNKNQAHGRCTFISPRFGQCVRAENHTSAALQGHAFSGWPDWF